MLKDIKVKKEGATNDEKFIQDIIDNDYGCKDFYVLEPMKEYDPDEDPVNGEVLQKGNNESSSKDGDDY